MENMRGYQLVVHGYFTSCMVFFYVQYKTKKVIESKNEPNKDGDNKLMALKIFVVSLVGTALAEIASLPFYYPFDLVKVRMQTM